MVRVPAQGVVQFKCHCGQTVAGDPADALIHTQTHKTQEVTAMYEQLLGNAAADRVNLQVRKDCPGGCGRDYMTQIRVGKREVVVHICACGFDSSRAGPLAGPAR